MLTLLMITAAAAWMVAAPDQKTLAATRGAWGAVRSGAAAATDVVHADRTGGHRTTTRATGDRTTSTGGAGPARSGSRPRRSGPRSRWATAWLVVRAATAAAAAAPAGARAAAGAARARRQANPRLWTTTGLAARWATRTGGRIPFSARPGQTPPAPAPGAGQGRPGSSRVIDPEGNPIPTDPTDPAAGGARAWEPPMAEATHDHAGRALSPAQRRYLWLRANGYRGPVDADGYPTDEHGRRLSLAQTQVAARAEATPDPGTGPAGAGTDPAGGPAGGTTTSKEDTTMPSDSVTGLTDEIMTAAEALKPGELESTADLRQETDQAEQLAETLQELQELLRKWAAALSEAYADAPFSTRGLSEAVTGVEEASGDPADLLEALITMRQALDEADALGEAGEAVEAEGKVEAFAAQ